MAIDGRAQVLLEPLIDLAQVSFLDAIEQPQTALDMVGAHVVAADTETRDTQRRRVRPQKASGLNSDDCGLV